jgi:hypothetical protein
MQASTRGTTRRWIADLPRAQVGRDGRAARARDQQRGRDGPRLLDDRQHRRGAGEGLRAELLDQATDLERDDRAEGDRDQGRGDDGDRRDEPGLLDELTPLERAPEQPSSHVQREGEQLARGAEWGDHACSGERH